MLVHIALTKADERELYARVSDCIRRAVISALDPGNKNCVQVVTEQTLDLKAVPLQAQAEQADVAAVVLIYPTEQISGKKKRVLFGRIGEGLEKEHLMGRKELVIGIIEQPHQNWYYGGAAMKLEQMMASGFV